MPVHLRHLELRCVSAPGREGRTIWIANAHHDHGKCFAVRADENLTAFPELEAAIRVYLRDAI